MVHNCRHRYTIHDVIDMPILYHKEETHLLIEISTTQVLDSEAEVEWVTVKRHRRLSGQLE